MSFSRYPAFKQSPIEWLNEIPAGWSIAPLKVLASYNDDVIRDDEPGDSEILYVDISGVDGLNGIVNVEPMLFSSAPSRARRRVRDGDVIVSTVRTYLRAIARIEQPAANLIVSTGFAVVRPRTGLAPNFLGYLMSANFFIEQVIARSTGVSYPAINASDLMRIPVSVPPQNEQLAIAAFLDRETAKIDELVAEQRRLIELLKEKRQAVISHAVTKGLNPDAPLKPAGIEWLGDVPAHWQLEPLKRSITKISQGWSPQCESEPAEEGEWGVLKVGCCNLAKFAAEEQKALPAGVLPIPEYEVKSGDIVMSRGNTLELVGSAVHIESTRPLLMLSDLLYRFRAIPDLADAEFLALSLRSSIGRFQIERAAVGTSASMKKISQAVINEMIVCLPPLQEQRLIVSRLKAESTQLDQLSLQANRAIELLRERRIALISAAVTGKIDVRGLVDT